MDKYLHELLKLSDDYLDELLESEPSDGVYINQNPPSYIFFSQNESENYNALYGEDEPACELILSKVQDRVKQLIERRKLKANLQKIKEQQVSLPALPSIGDSKFDVSTMDSAKTVARPKPSVERLINRAVSIETELAQEAGELGFFARAMIQATLPHRKVNGNEFIRKNGNYTLNLIAPSDVGLPYGSIPRLLLAWVTTEAVCTKSRELDLGDSMAAFMAELGMSRQGGVRGDITKLKDQAKRLFSCTISAIREDVNKWERIGYTLADEADVWWDKNMNQTKLFNSTITLSERFYNEIVKRPVPVDIRVLKALRKSPLAIDTYCWLTYKASYTTQSTLVPWNCLELQFGSDYSRRRAFKEAFLGELKKVVTVYSAVQVEAKEDGLLVKPFPTHIRKVSK